MIIDTARQGWGALREGVRIFVLEPRLSGMPEGV